MGHRHPRPRATPGGAALRSGNGSRQLHGACILHRNVRPTGMPFRGAASHKSVVICSFGKLIDPCLDDLGKDVVTSQPYLSAVAPSCGVSLHIHHDGGANQSCSLIGARKVRRIHRPFSDNSWLMSSYAYL